jgi:hypothetical protein
LPQQQPQQQFANFGSFGASFGAPQQQPSFGGQQLNFDGQQAFGSQGFGGCGF